MDVTLKEPTNIAPSGPSGHTAWQNIYVFASTPALISASIIWGQSTVAHATNRAFTVNKIRTVRFSSPATAETQLQRWGKTLHLVFIQSLFFIHHVLNCFILLHIFKQWAKHEIINTWKFGRFNPLISRLSTQFIPSFQHCDFNSTCKNVFVSVHSHTLFSGSNVWRFPQGVGLWIPCTSSLCLLVLLMGQCWCQRGIIGHCRNTSKSGGRKQRWQMLSKSLKKCGMV